MYQVGLSYYHRIPRFLHLEISMKNGANRIQIEVINDCSFVKRKKDKLSKKRMLYVAFYSNFRENI